jgi:hypothetical protein
MPAEVLSYFLKHEDIRLKLKFQLVLQCAPFLKGLKVSCGITMEQKLYGELSCIFEGTSIRYRKLSEADGKCLVLFYRENELEEYLKRTKVRSLIHEFGYQDMNLDEMLTRLSCRISLLASNDMGFPHEIGLFFGYPVEDVKGFIHNAGREYLLLGYWKVYSNISRARVIFKSYDQAKVCAVNEFLAGKSIKDIACSEKSLMSETGLKYSEFA